MIMNQTNIQQSAEGMMRNFGADAWDHAEKVAVRIGKRDPDGAELWKAIADTIKHLEKAPASP